VSTDPLERCIQQLARFPGIGQRTATRLAYWLVRQEPHVAAEIASAIEALPQEIRRCSICCTLTPMDPCARCSDPRRDAGLICVVEQPQDIASIEATGEYRGRYHVLMGSISPLDGVGPDELRIRELLARVEGGAIREVLVATDPDVEGDTTALYLASLLKPLRVRVTRLAHGIAVGTELEYADKGSVARAIENRREL